MLNKSEKYFFEGQARFNRQVVASHPHESFSSISRELSFAGMADNDQRRKFLTEIKFMKDMGSQDNIVNMLGCCTVREPMFLLVEYAPYGDLLHYLRRRRTKVERNMSIKHL